MTAMPNEEIPSTYAEKKKQNSGGNSQKALHIPFPLQWGRLMQGREGSFQVMIWWIDLKLIWKKQNICCYITVFKTPKVDLFISFGVSGLIKLVTLYCHTTVSSLLMDTSITWTPVYYGQFVWSQKCQKSYIPDLYNTDTSVKQTLGSVPLVSVLKRFDCVLFGEGGALWKVPVKNNANCFLFQKAK